MLENFFKKHPELTLIGLAIFFVLVIAGSFFWGITTLVGSLNKAAGAGEETKVEVPNFDLQGAAGLDLKGALK